MAKDELPLAPIVFIDSGEPALAERAVDQLKRRARQADPETDITSIDPTSYSAGELDMLTTPSLFGEPRMIIIDQVQQLNTALQNDLLRYISAPEADVNLVVVKHKGTRGKKVYDALKTAKVPTASFKEVKTAAEKSRLVMSEVRAHHRRMTESAVGALIDALGSDMRELLAGTRQLLADIDGTIDKDHVDTYFAGRIEANGFNVADAVIAGNVGKAIELSRHAIATNASPVAIVSAIAMRLRTMAQVMGARSNAFDMKIPMAPWAADRARRDLRAWSANGLALAIRAIAQADADVKGASRDPGYALERGILEIGRARRVK
ncbi:MAG: DNA polymerase III subunit delta [Actinomycetaceae bacterium]|nr:DNA polymerase III subunit delta [Actinomycetaceae bacterium]